MTHTFPLSLLKITVSLDIIQCVTKQQTHYHITSNILTTHFVLLCVLFHAFKKHSQVGPYITRVPGYWDTETLRSLLSLSSYS